MDFIKESKELLGFIEASPSPYHGVLNLEKMLKDAGFIKLYEGKPWEIYEGGKYFVSRNSSAIVAFTLPMGSFTGFNIVASHSDSPCFKIKDKSSVKVEGNYTKLNTEGYGGMIMPSWLDRPLSAAGRVVTKTAGGIKESLIDLNYDLMVIPNLAIHMQRDINDGHKYNPQVDMLPLLGDENSDIEDIVARELGVEKADVLSSDLFLYPRVKGSIIGAQGQFIHSPRLDDLQCAYASIKALIMADTTKNVGVAAVLDNEEVGSGTKQGAASTFLRDVLQRLSDAWGKNNEEFRIALANSFMISADNAHAVHPNFTEKFDKENKCYLNKGPAIKFNANQKYTTDAVSASVFRLICQRAEVPCQGFHNRSDMPGGSTLGNISSGQISINSVDIGIPQLAMHSCVETGGVKDTAYTVEAMRAFYTTVVRTAQDGLWLD